jgi:hypothetical protein
LALGIDHRRVRLRAVSTPSGDLPPPPPSEPAHSPTQIVGQQVEPSSTVPHTPSAPMTAAPGTQTNSLAVISLVAGIGSFFAHVIPGLGGFTVAVVAIVTGYMARNQIKQTGEQGMGLATAGMIIGIIHIALILVVVVFILVLVFIFGIAIFGMSRSSSG